MPNKPISNKHFTLVSNIFLGVVQDWYKSVFRVKVPEPIHKQMDGRIIGALEVLPVQTVTYIVPKNLCLVST